jgi:protein-S-isoprenylcysteine O-methyltransferase Ste14
MDSRYVSPILMWAIAFSGAAIIAAIVPAIPVLQKSPATEFVFALLLVNWLGFYILGRWQNHEAENSAGNIKKLQTGGVYSLVRHPIYFADCGLSVGMIFFYLNLNALFASLFVIGTLYYWAGMEEEALLKKFGRKYRDYQNKVPKFIPLLPWA